MTNTALANTRVGLSGAVPEPEGLAKIGLTETEFPEAVGGRLGHREWPSLPRQRGYETRRGGSEAPLKTL
ncbi:MAG: hypothetical protein ACHQ50_15390 [Fimbriimonadales bacterium]